MEYQLSLELQPDAFRQVGFVKYWLYNYIKLTEQGYIVNRHVGPSVFTYCIFCEGYRWFIHMSKPGSPNTIAVCDTCHNHATATKLEYFAR